jgi:signal peptidase I
MENNLPSNSQSSKSTHPKLPSQQHESAKSIISTLFFLIMAPAIAIILTMFVFQSYEVDGQSMERSLQNNDRLVVLKAPRSWARITKHAYIPNRGDIIIFNLHSFVDIGSGNLTTDKQLIKRVIGLPGERVVVKEGKVRVYNSQNPTGFLPDETLEYKVPVPTVNEVFVLGDNRSNSTDSRIFGTVPSSDIVGKLVIRVFPFNKTKIF